MSKYLQILAGSALAAVPISLAQVGEGHAQDLQSFAVISGETLTNTGLTTIDGNIALSPGTAYTGAGPGENSVTQTGQTFLTDAVAARIQNDLTTLYTYLVGRTTSSGGNLTGQDLAGMTLAPGVYNFDTSANLATDGVLKLDAGGNPDAIFIINIGSTLTAGSGSSVELVNGAQGGNVFYRVGSSATLDTSARLVGQIVALTSITMNSTASIDCGAAYARNGSVTLIENTIRICTLAGSGFDTAVDDVSLTGNQRSVSRALSDYVADGGALPLSFAIVAATQSPEELAASLAQLSGEVATGVAPMGMQATDAFLDTVMRSGRAPRIATTVAPDQDGVPIGMVREKINAPYGDKYGAAEPVGRDQALAFVAGTVEQARPWDIWASAYGSRNVTDGDASLGVQERTSQNSGLAAGLNFSPSARTDVGIALSWNTADFTLSNGYGSGTSDTGFVALRGRTTTERAYVEGALAYGRSDITTERTVTIAGTDRLIGETTADTLAAHVEAGYHMGIFTPFVGLRAQSFTTQAYSETAETGSLNYALKHVESTTTSLRSELGVAMQWPAVGPAVSGTPVIGLRAAWAHEFASNEAGTRSFLEIPDASFTASGATRDRNSLLLAASVGMSAANGLYADGAVNAEYSGNSQDFGGSLTVGYRW